MEVDNDVEMERMVEWIRSVWEYHCRGAMHVARMAVPVYTAVVVSFVSMIMSWGEVMGWLGVAGFVGFGWFAVELWKSVGKARKSADSYHNIWVDVLYGKLSSVEEIRRRVSEVFPGTEKGIKDRYGGV